MKLNKKILRKMILNEIKNMKTLSEGRVSFTFNKRSPIFKDAVRSKDTTFYVNYDYESENWRAKIKSVTDSSGKEYTNDAFWDQLFNDKIGLTTGQISQIEIEIRRAEESKGNKIKNVIWPW